MDAHSFPGIDRFRDRTDELAAMDAWFEDGVDTRAMALHGRRRVGKSWLFRAFAHGRPADIFVSDTRALADQLDGFSVVLGRDGERPALPDLETFLRLLYRRAAKERRLAVIDELPYLWRVEPHLPSILLRLMEEEAGRSQLKLMIAGSHVGMMERLLAEREPLHDRLRPLRVRPLDLWRAKLILGHMRPEQLITAYGLAGGMPHYLSSLAGADDPAKRLAELAMERSGALFDEPRAVLAQELEAPHVYFSILSSLAAGPQPWAQVVARSKVASETVSRYIATLQVLGIVVARVPVTDVGRVTRTSHYSLGDGFLRFWFRFVLPFQSELEAGVDPRRLFASEVAPHLSSHLAPAVEEIVRDWVRRRGTADVTRVGGWWGPSVNALRRAGIRTTEEIDVVGIADGRVVLVGEVRWRSAPMDVGVLGELDRFKLPALRQAATVVDDPVVVLVSRAGFTPGLRDAAARATSIRLVELDELVE